jgi:hypothetical protein
VPEGRGLRGFPALLPISVERLFKSASQKRMETEVLEY